MTAEPQRPRRALGVPAAQPVAPTSDRRLTLLSRAYCGLCDIMRDAVLRSDVARGCTVDVVDVDADPALEARWGELVPVLFLGAPEPANELCHYHFDEPRVASALCAHAARAGKTCTLPIVVASDRKIR